MSNALRKYRRSTPEARAAQKEEREKAKAARMLYGLLLPKRADADQQREVRRYVNSVVYGGGEWRQAVEEELDRITPKRDDACRT